MTYTKRKWFDFQTITMDYNAQVLGKITIVNIFVNNNSQKYKMFQLKYIISSFFKFYNIKYFNSYN